MFEATLRCVWRMHWGLGLLGPRRDGQRRKRAAGCELAALHFLDAPLYRWEASGNFLILKIGHFSDCVCAYFFGTVSSVYMSVSKKEKEKKEREICQFLFVLLIFHKIYPPSGLTSSRKNSSPGAASLAAGARRGGAVAGPRRLLDGYASHFLMSRRAAGRPSGAAS